MPMLKLCAYQKQLFHPPLYLSHAQKMLPQTVTVPRPYLRLPWRSLHPQVGKTHSPITRPRMCPITCWFGVPPRFVLFFLVHWMCERSEAKFLLYTLLSTRCKVVISLRPPTVHTFTCLCIFHTCIFLEGAHAFVFALLCEHVGRQGFTVSINCTQISHLILLIQAILAFTGHRNQ